MPKKIETRSIEISPTLEENVLSGTASVFDKKSEDLGGFNEIISRHAFDNVDMTDLVMLYNHESGNVLSRSSASTLVTDIDELGLHFRSELPNTTLGKDTAENVRNGNIRGMSFGFVIAKRSWIDNGDDIPTQVIEKVDRITEISLTPFPAYKDTDVSLSQRSLEQHQHDEKQVLLNKEWLSIQKSLYGG